MGKYAVIVDGVIVNVVVCDNTDFAAQHGLMALNEGFWIGDLWDNENGFAKAL